MPSPSVTYTFSNSTTADATQVNQNFTDLINGMSDGTKDLSVSALTAAGTATLNGDVNLGNATADTLVITASLNSSITNKTTFTNDLGGATAGMKSIYLASNDAAARSVRLIAGAVTASYAITWPTAQGAAGTYMKNDGSGNLSFVRQFLTARASTAAGQVVAASNTDVINFDTVTYDADSTITTGAAWKFTVPTGAAGRYTVRAHVLCDSVVCNAGSGAGLYIYKNGSVYARMASWISQLAHTAFPFLNGSDSIDLAAGDYIDLRLYNFTPNAVTIDANNELQHVSVSKEA